VILVLALLAAPDAPAAVELSGYLQPQMSWRYRDAALPPRDRWSFGAEDTVVGIIVSGKPLPAWSYTAHLELGAELVRAITGVEAVDEDGNGDPDDVSTTDEGVVGRFAEELTIEFAPVEYASVKAGQMRIPFTAQQQSPNTALMFAKRAGPNEVFLSGSDLGALLSASVRDRLLVGRLGIFNGTDRAAGADDVRGILWALRVDAEPLGALSFEEADLARGPLRFGLGGGVLYSESSMYDDTGFDSAHGRDWRFAASARLAFSGLYLQTEWLRRLSTDDLSSRPELATGWYAQGSYAHPVLGELLALSGRFGWVEEDQGFDPRTTWWNEVGLALYLAGPTGPDTVRVLLQYQREARATEGETAHGAAAQVQVQF
jgi:hypothetical protein